MGVFVQPSDEKGTKIILMIRITIGILMFVLFILGIIYGFNSTIRWFCLLAIGGSAINGIERRMKDKVSKLYIIHFGFVFVWIVLALSL